MNIPDGEVRLNIQKPTYNKARWFAFLNYDSQFVEDRYWEADKRVDFPVLGNLPHYSTVWSGPEGSLDYPNEIYLDGEMVGSTPSTLVIPSGHHTIRIHADGHSDWDRDL